MMFAAGAEIPYVMAQVGHADSKVTLEIYARALKRRDRDEASRAFDELLVGRPVAALRRARHASRVAGEAPHRTPGMAREPARSRRIRAKGRAKEGFQQALPPGPNTAETREPPQVQGLL